MISLLYRVADRLRRARRDESAGAQGVLGEDLAHRYLRDQGCTVVARNYRPRYGGIEIDLVAWHQGKLAIVEVKARESDEFGTPDRAVDAEKQGYLVRAARDYTRRAGIAWPDVRFDIVSVVLSQPPRVEWIRDAFRGPPSHV